MLPGLVGFKIGRAADNDNEDRGLVGFGKGGWWALGVDAVQDAMRSALEAFIPKPDRPSRLPGFAEADSPPLSSYVHPRVIRVMLF
jgi:hypothetical protein